LKNSSRNECWTENSRRYLQVFGFASETSEINLLCSLKPGYHSGAAPVLALYLLISLGCLNLTYQASQGRPFSWQEALIALATIFQKFDFVPVDPAYKLRIKQTITLKPQAFKFRAIARNDAPSFSVIAPVHISASASTTPTLTSDNIEKGIPLYVFYGSNSGSCEGFAQTIASKAAGQGTYYCLFTFIILHIAWFIQVSMRGLIHLIVRSTTSQPTDLW
jgi:cytochrome P450/NADPH-cytochrome P450 reductase